MARVRVAVCAVIGIPSMLAVSPNALAQECASRQIGERCQISFSAVAGTCSKDTDCRNDTGWLEFSVPSGYAVVNWRSVDESWNGGNFNAQNASRGQNSQWRQSFLAFSQAFKDIKAKLDYLSQDVNQISDVNTKRDVQHKLDVLSSELKSNQSMWNSVSNADTNIDMFRLRAESWYTCTVKTWFGCVDGKGNQGKGRVVADLVFIGDAAQITSNALSLRKSASDLEAEIAQAKK